MKISSTDAVRRGAANVVANWQTVAFRALQEIGLFAVIGGGVLVIASGGLRSPEELKELFFGSGGKIAAFVLVVLMAAVLSLLLHAFISAGNAQIYIDGAFDGARWLHAARARFVTVAGIYLILGAALIAFAFGTALILGLASALGPLACCGIAIMMPLWLLAIVVSIIVSAKAVVIAVERRSDAADSLSVAWQEMKGDAARHAVVSLLIGGIAIVAGLMLSVASGMMNLLQPRQAASLLAPVDIVITAVQQLISSAMDCWYSAAMTELTVDRRPPAAPPEPAI